MPTKCDSVWWRKYATAVRGALKVAAPPNETSVGPNRGIQLYANALFLHPRARGASK